ncbi:DJ-1/PfpI family protein [Hymenobacter sp. YC55]|uniref:DJ-1/PfpI family protein n=1 Tax=Hymenobacter sp. YC55 TaxID=3034019 RepID=UPI0023F78044|nr:DJ-1/PfpI family protein [Hymenobacter sp. YC55]MDF7815872.1 DJ-1/PfpI family protein [Hymenobacter sp. YC55]
MRTVAVLLFNQVDLLAFSGPAEVFRLAGVNTVGLFYEPPFQVFTVGAIKSVRTGKGLRLLPAYHLNNHPRADLLVIPGGVGIQRIMRNQAVLHWLHSRAQQAEMVLSVSTGAFILGQAGLLNYHRATTHQFFVQELAQLVPTATIEYPARFVEHGRIVTAAGAAAGIEASLHIVGKLLGEPVAAATAAYLQYR